MKLRKRRKSKSEQGVEAPVAPPQQEPKRRGRPPLDKAKQMLTKITEDVVAMSEKDFDGGGTPQDAPVVTKESLERRVARRLNVLDRFLTDDRLIELMLQSGLKEIGVYEGIMLDKALVLKGQPTVIIGNEDRQAMDTVLPRILSELKRRKLITSVSERKIEFTDAGA